MADDDATWLCAGVATDAEGHEFNIPRFYVEAPSLEEAADQALHIVNPTGELGARVKVSVSGTETERYRVLETAGHSVINAFYGKWTRGNMRGPMDRLRDLLTDQTS